jgi:ureidoacrylate peracid hydrolase
LRSPALLVIDVQNDFAHHEGTAASRGADVTAVQAAARNIQALLATARAHAVPTIFVRVVHGDWYDAGAWAERHRGSDRAPGPRNAEEGSWGSEFYEVAPGDGELVLTKTRYSAFAGTPLRRVLHGLDVDEVVLTGTQTDVCILATAFDAIQEGFRVTVVSDCVASPRSELHRAALDIVRLRAGRVVRLEEAQAQFERLSVGTGTELKER